MKINDIIRYQNYTSDDRKSSIRKMRIVEMRLLGDPKNLTERFIGETVSGKDKQWIYEDQIVK